MWISPVFLNRLWVKFKLTQTGIKNNHVIKANTQRKKTALECDFLPELNNINVLKMGL